MSSPAPDYNSDISLLISASHHTMSGKIAKIVFSSQFLLNEEVGPINEKQKLFLEIISNEGKWLVKAAEAFATLARIKAGISTPIEKVDLAQCINEVTETLLHKFESKGQSLSVEHSDLPLVLANASQLISILFSLLDNAHRYTPSGGKITLTAANLDEGIKVTVTDTGIGIVKEDQEKIFELFFRANHPIVREQEGLGVELFFVKYYVEYLGGKIGVESELGKGSKFWFTIPFAA